MLTSPLEERIDRIGRSIRQIARNLGALGFRFERPDQVLPGPVPDTDQAIARIESEIGEVPLALKLFWTRVGGVDLCGQHAAWSGEIYPDPLVVYPPAIAIYELEQFLGDRQKRLECNFPYLIPIAPDALTKADVSGGMWYNVDVPASGDDPPLNDEPHGTTFLNYLDIAIAWGGFPGLVNTQDHTWPIKKIVRSGESECRE